jgi:hypothetical protein|nr:MAG TPA: hypothetical protein [Caudoviricetes sp.]
MIPSPDPQFPYHVEINSIDKPPFDVRLKDNFKSKSKCKNCGKYIYRGITKNLKKIPISLIVDPWGASIPAVHWEVCKKKF